MSSILKFYSSMFVYILFNLFQPLDTYNVRKQWLSMKLQNFINDADDDTGEGRAGQSQGASAGWQ